jgi:hypothetical protein
MNERIKELWSQAGGHYNSGNQHTWPEYTIDDPEKFAELIVRECARIASNADLEDVEGGDSAVLRAVNSQILEHFGVEE